MPDTQTMNSPTAVDNDTTSSTRMMSDIKYQHFVTKTLNNQGCHWILKGNYEAAIENLTRALHLTRNEQSLQLNTCNRCSCEFCGLEYYLKITHDESESESKCAKENENQDSLEDTDQHLRSALISSSKRIRSSIINSNSNSNSNCQLETKNRAPIAVHRDDNGFIYQQAMFVNQQCIEECHYMGGTLSFIVLFNIALAHHLKAIDMFHYQGDSRKRHEVLRQALRLYELAYQLHFECNIKQESEEPKMGCEDCDDNAYQSNQSFKLANLRLMMLVTNNISEIHRLSGNTATHNMCLEHLLNAIMYMITNCQNKKVLSQSEKDGIFENLAPILRSKVYAAAA